MENCILLKLFIFSCLGIFACKVVVFPAAIAELWMTRSVKTFLNILIEEHNLDEEGKVFWIFLLKDDLVGIPGGLVHNLKVQQQDDQLSDIFIIRNSTIENNDRKKDDRDSNIV